ncbi:MAG: hypothetical protein IKU07_05150 [Oscillospiraceae bacterium]|nr:hypothetical protein [Oscillospiraceae bacterium]
MKKKLIALCLLLGLLLGALGTGAAATEDTSMYVGFSPIDINPYVYHYVDENRAGEIPVEIFTDENGREYYTNWNRDAEGNTQYELMPLPLRGFREPMERLSLTYKMDDNGDGLTNEADGLHGTCVVMTAADGSTLITISLDLIGVDEGTVLNMIRNAVHEATGVPREYIMVQGTHTHFAPDFSNITTNMSTSQELYIRYNDGKYFTGAEVYNYLVEYREDLARVIGEAAARAMDDRAKAVMSKGSLDTSEAENCPEGYRMNVVRHYQMTRQKILKVGGEYVQIGGKYIADPTGAIVNYVAGDNFNGGGDPVGNRYGSYVITAAQSVAESDDMLHALYFTFPGTDKEPVAMFNWRAHPCNNRSIAADKDILGWPNDSSYYQVSGDYVNAFRRELQSSGIRASFHQGASGNINGGDATLATSWTAKYGTDKGNIYGSRLGKIALELVGEDSTSLEQISGGQIRVASLVYHNSGNTNSPAMLAAAKLYEEYYEGPIPLEGEGYRVVDSNGSGYGETGERVIDTTTGAYVTIASRYHASAVLSRDKVKGKAAYGRVEIGAATIGSSVAFVSAPGELYDRYDINGTVLDSPTTGWASLVNEETFGTPFVLGYCNGTRGYFPNVAAYSYNYGNRDSKGALSNDAVGSYESQTTRLAPGGGEELISLWKDLLNRLQNKDESLPAVCEHCGVEVIWSPWDQQNAAAIDSVSSGHYYLTEDVTGYTKELDGGRDVCLYLNGHSFTGGERAFTVKADCTLNIMGEGKIMGSNISQGGAICVYGKAECNLYGGTVTVTDDFGQLTKQGGAVYVLENGVFNQYGGTITGGSSSQRGGNVYTVGRYTMYGGSITGGCTNGNGGNVYVSGSGSFAMYGGTISGGRCEQAASEDVPCGGNIYADGPLTMYGGTVADGYAYWAGGNIYVLKNATFAGGSVTGGSVYKVSKCVHVANNGQVRLEGNPTITQIRSANSNFLTVAGRFTGNVIVDFANAPAIGAEVGVSENAVFSSNNLKYKKSGNTTVFRVNKGKLVMSIYMKVAQLSDGTTYESLNLAVEAAQNTNKTVMLLAGVGEKLLATGNVTVDLHGHNITGGAAVTGNVYIKDSKTDDYTVTSGGYGKLSGTITGSVQPAEGYMAITEADGTSYHRTEIELTHVNLRPNVTGVYFTANFRADEVVKANTKSFGIALNVAEAPNAENMHTTTVATALTDWAGESHSVLVRDILKVDKDFETNWNNGSARIYACTYVQTEEGYSFGNVAAVSLEELTELASASWDTLTDFQQGSLLDMYSSWWDVMDYWHIPEIINAF